MSQSVIDNERANGMIPYYGSNGMTGLVDKEPLCDGKKTHYILLGNPYYNREDHE